MNCSKCNSPKVLVESVSPGKKKLTCQECSHSELRDSEGRKQLTETMPVPAGNMFG